MILFQILTMIPKIVYYWRRSISDIAPDEHFFPTNFLLKYIELEGFLIHSYWERKNARKKLSNNRQKTPRAFKFLIEKDLKSLNNNWWEILTLSRSIKRTIVIFQ